MHNNRSGLYDEEGELDLAEARYDRVAAIWKAHGSHTDLARSLDNHAAICLRKGDMDKAKALFLETQALFHNGLESNPHGRA